jgi:chemotaxis protein methyltransferase CheR
VEYSLSDTLLSQCSDFVAARLGLHFPPARWLELERKISLAARELGFADSAAFIQSLASPALTRAQVEILASHLTIGETYFFRENRAMEFFAEQILPELIHSRRGTDPRLRIWSAGCCTGEEPYSIAIALSQALPDLRDWHITVLATDINPQFLQKAVAGVYSEWSFRGVPAWIQERYFRKRNQDGRFEILPAIRKMVTFAQLNLAKDAYPSLTNNTNAMDVIFCRNVLMYLVPERARQVVQNLHRSLVEGGWLIVSPTEASSELFSQFVTVNRPRAILYKKDSRKSPGLAAFPSQQPSADSLTPQAPPLEPVAKPGLKAMLPRAGQRESTAELQPSLYQEVLALYAQGQYGQIVEHVARFLPGQEESALMTLLARAYANQGQLKQALAWCDRAIAADKLDPSLHYLRATILQEQNQIDEAVASLKRALYLDPNFVLAYVAMGNLALRQENLREAAKSFDNALSLLSAYRPEDMLPESEGITAGRLREVIQFSLHSREWA